MRMSPLRVPAFRRLAATYTLNELCWSFGTIALAVVVYDRTGSALATTALFLATTFAPALLAPALTARLDRLAVRRTLPGLYLCEAAVFAALAATAGRVALPAVLALALADGAVAIVGRALTRASVAAVLEPGGTLAAGNKLLNVCFSVAFATGPAVAGLLVAHAGAGASLLATAGLFTIMAAAIAACRGLPAASGDGDRSWRARLVAGVRYVGAEPTIRPIFGAHAAALVFLAFGPPIEVVYVRASLHASDLVYGLLLACWGAGTVVSSLALARLRALSPLVLIPLGAGAMGGGYLAWAAAPSPAVAMAGALLGGAGNGAYYVSVVQAIQERVGASLQARVMSLLESVNAACTGIGFLAGGAVAAVFDPRVAFAVSAAGVLLAAAVIRALLADGAALRRSPAAPLAVAAEPAG